MGWFVPVLNLWRPKQIANDIWRGSDPDLPDPAWTDPVPKLLGLWWAAWIVSTFISGRALASELRAGTALETRAALIADIVSLGLDILAALLAILVVRSATARQETRAQRQLRGAAPASAAGDV